MTIVTQAVQTLSNEPLEADNLLLGSGNRAIIAVADLVHVLECQRQRPKFALRRSRGGKSALNMALFTFMIDSGTHSESDLLAVFAELEFEPDVPPTLDPRPPASLRGCSDLVKFLFR